MKRALLVIGALLMVFSGVAAVSAYESHLVNVEAKVENAAILGIPWPGGKLLFGTAFPQEFLKKDFLMRFSDSFSAPGQLRVEHLDYQVWVEAKPGDLCLADAMYIGVQDVLWVGPKANDYAPVPMDFRPTSVTGDLVPVGTCTLPVMVTSDTLSKVDASPPPGGLPGVQWVNHGDNIAAGWR